VRYFFAANLLLQDGPYLVTHTPKPVCKTRRVIEVGRFQPHAQQSNERCGSLTRRYTLPEPIPNRERAHLETQRFDVRLVHAHVSNLVLRDARQAEQEFGRSVCKAQDGPTHQLRRLQFVMPELVQQLCAVNRLAHARGA
jgi:hypothetical protein